MSFLKTADEINLMGDMAIVPVGSLEQHGPHLPVITDTVLAQEIANRIGERLGAFVLPCLPISTAYEHKGKKGSVWMNPDTFFRMLCDIVLNLKGQGYKKVVVLRGHGGIFVMDPVIRHLNAEHNPGLLVCRLDPYFDNRVDEICETKCHIHAEEMETSIMLYLRPELVKMERAVDFVPVVPREFLNYGSIFRYSPDGVWGFPCSASAGKGKLILESCVEESIVYVNRVFNMMSSRDCGY